MRSASGYDGEGAYATTATYPPGGTFRACTTAHVDGGEDEVVTVCTA